MHVTVLDGLVIPRPVFVPQSLVKLIGAVRVVEIDLASCEGKCGPIVCTFQACEIKRTVGLIRVRIKHPFGAEDDIPTGVKNRTRVFHVDELITSKKPIVTP